MSFHNPKKVILYRSNISADSYEENADLETLYHSISFYCALFMVIICIMGLFGNGLSIYVFSRKSMRRSSINTLLLGLSVIDFLLVLIIPAIFAIPPILEAAADADSELQDDPVFNHVHVIIAYCSVYIYPVAMILQTSSVWIFLIITAERFLAVCHPLQVSAYCTVVRARLSLLVVFILAFLYNLVRFWEFQMDSRSEMVEMLLRANKKYWLWYGTIAYLITQFAMPFLLIAILNFTVVSTIYKAKRERARLSRSERSEHRTGIMMLMVVLTFGLCYTLSFVMNFYEAVDEDLFSVPPRNYYAYMANDASNTLVAFNSSSTWIIYLLFSRKYRVLTIRLLTSLLPRACTKKMFESTHLRTLDDTCGEQSWAFTNNHTGRKSTFLSHSGRSANHQNSSKKQQSGVHCNSDKLRNGSHKKMGHLADPKDFYLRLPSDVTSHRQNPNTSMNSTRSVQFRSVSNGDLSNSESCAFINDPTSTSKTKLLTIVSADNSPRNQHLDVLTSRV